MLFMQVGCKSRIRMPDLKETYASRDTKPFGGYIAKSILQNSFPGNYIQTTHEPIYKNSSLIDDSSSVYFSASRNLYMNEADVEALLNYVYAGNTAFFATNNFDSILLKKLYCKVTGAGVFSNYIPGIFQDTYSKLIQVINSSKDSFGYYYNPFVSHFSEINDRYCRIVGYNSIGKPNCIVFWWGKGKLFLHTDPRAFSNYFLLSKENFRYMKELMQVTQETPQHVYWDDYYNKINKPKRDENSSTLSELFKHASLKAAFWLLLLMLFLYILFGGKRRQRIIREIKPNQNSSVAFTETIAKLYLQNHDNKSIADKMITYFYEFARNNYYLNVAAGNKEMISLLSRKAGVSEEHTSDLFKTLNSINESDEIDDDQLLTLNGQIQQFYKKKS